ncbi:MAG: WD40/YVTN/BNR-like repeat-containing protein [Candidatus Binatia bacterium]
MRVFCRILPFLLLVVLTACHDEPKPVTLDTRLITVADKFYDVKAWSAEKAVVVGYGGKILITTDGGKTWQAKPSGTDVALYNVEFVDEQNGWVCGQDGLIIHTTDGGETWKKQETGVDVPILALSFVDKNHGWAVAQFATYLRTTNGGETWEEGRIEVSLEGVDVNATLAMTDPTLYDIQFVDEKTGWMVGEFGKIYHSTDGGVTWTEQQNSLLGQAGFTDALNLPTWFGVRFVNATEGIAVGIEGKIVKTTDGGNSWSFIAQDISAQSTDQLFAPVWLDENDGWIVGASGRVLRLTDGKWQLASLGFRAVIWLRAIDFFDENNGWIVGGYGTILHTTDGGKTWFRSVG